MMWLFWLFIILILLIGITCFIVPLRKEQLAIKIFPVLLLPIATISLYFVWGNNQGVSAYYQEQARSQEVEAFLQQYQDPQQIIDMLKNRLAESEDATGWFLLGRLYSSMENYDGAASAFERANDLDPHNFNIMMQYVIALYFAHGNMLNDESQALIDELRAQDPKNPDVLNLLAVDAYQRKDYETAIVYWRELLAMFATDPQAQQELMSSIEQAQQAMGNENGKQQTQTVSLNVYVELANTFVNQVLPEQTVFVYAKAENGPSMPLAIVRYTVKDLPIAVTLDDSTSMNSTSHLSDFTAVKIYARVARQGQAEVQPGDLVGSSAIINPTQDKNTIKIEIDSIITS